MTALQRRRSRCWRNYKHWQRHARAALERDDWPRIFACQRKLNYWYLAYDATYREKATP